ncbi:MAG: SpoIIE family protein phosphatase [Alphaproteobacteria bacterium]|nr:SpoIIE family protein phosphatase [Alphaproteobacteria bacterium]
MVWRITIIAEGILVELAKHCTDNRPQNVRPELDQTPVLTVLVVDDSRLQRRLLTSSLTKWGYEIFEAESGRDALAICKAARVDLVISDWMMPEMDGLTFCREFRAIERENYGYFILLTSKDGKNEIAKGLDVGADDFLTKPVHSNELRARLQAGERVLGMQKELIKKNQSILQNLIELQELYQAVDRDLEEAKKLQLSLLPQTFRKFDNTHISMVLQSSGHVGGDMVGYYYTDQHRLGIFAFDVSGHGISSALMTARITGCLSAVDPAHSIAMEPQSDGSFSPLHPEKIAEKLNSRMLRELETELYLTILLADVDLRTGEVEFVQAGHPPPAILRPNKRVEFIGEGGMPIGLISDAIFPTFRYQLDPGDRFLIHSDGFTEAENNDGQFLNEDRFAEMLLSCQNTHGPELLSNLVSETQAFSGHELADDLSAVLLEYASG